MCVRKEGKIRKQLNIFTIIWINERMGKRMGVGKKAIESIEVDHEYFYDELAEKIKKILDAKNIEIWIF